MASQRRSRATEAPDEVSDRTLAQVQRALKTLSAGNRTLLRAQDEVELLHDMCRTIVDQGGYRLACVGYAVNDPAKHIHWMAAVGWEPSPESTWDDTERGRTAMGTAIRTGQAVIGRNLRTDPYSHSQRLLESGFQAVSAFPLLVDGAVIGALAMAAPEPDAFNAEESKLLSELADDLAYGIANLRMRAKHREAEAYIEKMAHYDALTGLLNRVSLREELAAAIDIARPQHLPLAVLHIKLGRYQEINDTLGYREADELLTGIGQRLAGHIREGETLARVGEADFAILLPGGGADQATASAQAFLRALAEPVELAGLRVAARARIGIAVFPGHGTDPDALMRRAKAAAYAAKHTASGYGLYTGSLDTEITRRLTLMCDLARAVERNELLLHFQPKVYIASGEVCGVESLLRWQHPLHGLLAPGEFIKLAEDAGLITPLTHWVLAAAFRQSYAWLEAGVTRPIAVNLSAQDLCDPPLFDRIKGLFATWGVSPELIQFELTESALMEDPSGAEDMLKRLKTLGVALAIDDFGTGYSSLSYLQKLPVDAIKIDQSFIANMLANDDSAIIVRSTIDLGHNLNLEVVAEGVADHMVWERLVALGCDAAQGYFVGEPIPPDLFNDWQARWRCP